MPVSTLGNWGYSIMSSRSSYVLLLAQQPEDLHGLESSLESLRYSVEVAMSPDQAVDRVRQEPPCLVILGSTGQPWSQMLVQKLRSMTTVGMITIVALTDSHVVSWLGQEDNPGFDGFLVRPISRDVLSSLVYSADARRSCFASSY